MDYIGSVVASPYVCIAWIIVGTLAGAFAWQQMKLLDTAFSSTVILGLIGAVGGGLIAVFLGTRLSLNVHEPELILINLVIATVGSMILIGLRRAVAH